MATDNPFDHILLKLDDLQSSIADLSALLLKKNATIDPVQDNRLLNLREAASLVKKPVGTVRHYIHHRNLPAKKIGKSFMIKYNDLMAWIETFNRDGQYTENTSMNPTLQQRKRYHK